MIFNLQSPSKSTPCCVPAPPECPSDLPNGELKPRSGLSCLNMPDARGRGSSAGLKTVSAQLSCDMVTAFLQDEKRKQEILKILNSLENKVYEGEARVC
jgi:hypothetical protein